MFVVVGTLGVEQLFRFEDFPCHIQDQSAFGWSFRFIRSGAVRVHLEDWGRFLFEFFVGLELAQRTLEHFQVRLGVVPATASEELTPGREGTHALGRGCTSQRLEEFALPFCGIRVIRIVDGEAHEMFLKHLDDLGIIQDGLTGQHTVASDEAETVAGVDDHEDRFLLLGGLRPRLGEGVLPGDSRPGLVLEAEHFLQAVELGTGQPRLVALHGGGREGQAGQAYGQSQGRNDSFLRKHDFSFLRVSGSAGERRTTTQFTCPARLVSYTSRKACMRVGCSAWFGAT